MDKRHFTLVSLIYWFDSLRAFINYRKCLNLMYFTSILITEQNSKCYLLLRWFPDPKQRTWIELHLNPKCFRMTSQLTEAIHILIQGKSLLSILHFQPQAKIFKAIISIQKITKVYFSQMQNSVSICLSTFTIVKGFSNKSWCYLEHRT